MKSKIISKILNKIALSLLPSSKISTNRIQSYILLLPILCMSVIFTGIEVYQFFHCINSDKDYYLSAEIIIVFGMILSHHLAILFSRSKSQSINEIKGTDETKNIEEEK